MPTTSDRLLTTPRPRRRTAALAVVLVATAALALACSKGPKAENDSAKAASILQENAGLSKEQAECVGNKMSADANIAAVMNTTDKATAAQKELYVAAMRECVPPDAFATLLSTSPDATPEQSTCVHDEVLKLSTSELDSLYLFFTDPTGGASVDASATTAKIGTTCKIATNTGTTAPGAAGEGSTTGTTAP